MEIRKILVPVDFSKASQRALEQAGELAAKLGAEIDVVHIAVHPSTYAPLDEWLWGEERETHSVERSVRDAAQTELDEFLRRQPEDLRQRIHGRLEVGVPYETIVNLARKGDYDLIVMGTHGREGAKRVLMGSVAERVVRVVPCPVMTVRS
jgi:nucleotide-binding universal stress UspA family protein